MGNVTQQIQRALDSKADIKAALEYHGLTVPNNTPFSQYAAKIRSIGFDNLAPSELTAEYVTDHLELEWTINSLNAEGHVIYTSPDDVTYTVLDVVLGSENTYVSDALPDVGYFIQVKAFKGDALSDAVGSEVNVSFDGLAPTLLSATAISDVRIDLAWTVNSTNRDGHRIYISTDNVTFTLKGTVLGATAVYSATGLTSATTYYFKVVAYEGTTESTAAIASATTEEVIVFDELAPINLTATPISTSQINLAWAIQSTNADGHRVYISIDNTNFTELGIVTGAENSYSATSLSIGTTYYFKVASYKGVYEGNAITTSATTQSEPEILSATATKETENSYEISTDINPNGETCDVFIEYGLSDEYGESVQIANGITTQTKLTHSLEV